MGSSVREEHLAHDEQRAGAARIGEQRDRLQQAVRARALGLPRRAPVEVPDGQLLERRLGGELHDLRLAAEIRDGLVAVEPDVLQLVLAHRLPFRVGPTKKAPPLPEW